MSNQTIDEARAILFDPENMREGKTCPCCDQHVQAYKRSLNAMMALGLLQLYKHHQNNPEQIWVHLGNVLAALASPAAKGGDVMKLRYWGLIEQSEDRVGYYRISPRGIAFVENRVAAPKYIHIYNEKPLPRPFDEVQTVMIVDALGKHFNYEDLFASEKGA